MMFRSLPIGIDDFKRIITENYCYVDKTLMIKELLDQRTLVNLFTRPRRFGKSLNMSMLQYFFEDTRDEQMNQENARLFEHLLISDCDNKYFDSSGKYPVISLSLKSAKQPDFTTAFYCLKEEIAREFKRHQYVMEFLTIADEKRRFSDIMNMQGSVGDFSTALKFLAECLRSVHNQNVVILIDEYDVPLENAYYCGFYDNMLAFIRSLFESALKTNPALEFAVITGCLRISKESIFTGLNNLRVMSILDKQYDEYFGFQPEEIDLLLSEYHLENHKEIITKWYDGYNFGDAKVYNPWSVINYIAEAAVGKLTFPRPYWSNTSSNSIVRDLVEHADASVKMEIETLLSGGAIEKIVHEDITYDTIYDSSDNLWNFLFFTGYLKQESLRMDGWNIWIKMSIPNEEVASIYDNTIRNWFRDEIKTKDLSSLYHAMLNGDSASFQQELSICLRDSISFMDSKEAFYHGFLLGLLNNMRDYLIKSNREAGNGRFDILVRSLDVTKAPVILELKVSESFKGMEKASEKALNQIEEKQYASTLPEEGYSGAWIYGIAFYKKQCLVTAKYLEF